jgi:hypothetical protein
MAIFSYRPVSLIRSRKRETKTRRSELRSAGKAIGRSKYNASCAAAFIFANRTKHFRQGRKPIKIQRVVRRSFYFCESHKALPARPQTDQNTTRRAPQLLFYVRTTEFLERLELEGSGL